MNKNIAGMMLALLLAGCGGEETEVMPTAHEVQIQSAAVNDGPTAVFIGDSITERWPELRERYPYYVDVGIHSQTSAMMLARFETDVLFYHPHNLVITAGTNDLLLLPDPTIDNIARMAEIASAHDIAVIIALPPPCEYWVNTPFPDEATGRAEFARFRMALRLLAQTHGYRVADFYNAMLLPDGTQNAALFLPDRQHPNLDGYAVMWHVVEQFFTPDPALPICSANPQSCF